MRHFSQQSYKHLHRENETRRTQGREAAQGISARRSIPLPGRPHDAYAFATSPTFSAAHQAPAALLRIPKCRPQTR
jgi:hypothetical protein